jgi:hypothetical protein
VLVVADGAEHPDREGRPEHAQVDGHVEARPPVLSDTCSIVAR